MYTVQYVGRKKGLCKPFGSFFLLLSVLFCCFSPHYVTSSKLLQYLRWKVTQNIVSSGSGSLSVSTVSSVAEPSDFGLGLIDSIKYLKFAGSGSMHIPILVTPAPTECLLYLHFHPYYCVLRCYTVEEEKVETYEICCVFFKKLAHDQNIARGSRLCNTVSSPFPF